MEIKLTADWIFLHNTVVYSIDGECYIDIYEIFQYYLFELALKTLDVNFNCEEIYSDSDVEYKHPFYRYSFKNTEDIKETCPQLYEEFQNEIQNERIRKKETQQKQDNILKFLEKPRSLIQIHNHLENVLGDKYAIKHTEYFVEDMIVCGLVKFKNEKYSLE